MAKENLKVNTAPAEDAHKDADSHGGPVPCSGHRR